MAASATPATARGRATRGGGLPADVLLVSLGSTAGLREADDALLASMRRAGARAETVRAVPPPPVRTLPLTDLAWALAARRAAVAGIRRHRPRAVLYSSVGAALLWPRPGAIRLDSPAAVNRPGRDGAWQRPRERALLRRASLLVPYAASTIAEIPTPRPAAVVVPHPVSASGPQTPWAARDVAAVAYAADPRKKALERVLAAWPRARRPGEWLVLAGAAPGVLPALPPGVHDAGRLAPADFRALLRRTRVLVHVPRREDHGQVPLEALADGCRLVTAPAAGAHVALPLARAVQPAWVVDRPEDPRELGGALRDALDAPREDAEPPPEDAEPPPAGRGRRGRRARGDASAPPASVEHDGLRAARLVATLAPEAVDRVVAETLLPALLAGA